MNLEHNIKRIKYLLHLYQIEEEELLEILNEGRTQLIEKEDLFSNEIKLSLLKKIDKIFNKGISFYLDPSEIPITKESSIFFRKEKFNTELNIESKQIVNRYEELKNRISAYAKLSEFETERILKIYHTDSHPQKVAKEVGGYLYPRFSVDKKKFLTKLISKFAEYNILVFEFVEHSQKIKKSNIDGFYLKPDVIVIRRNKISYKREIFTLLHELGHYLLQKEEIEAVNSKDSAKKDLSKVESWCNEFAFYFLLGKYVDDFEAIKYADKSNDYYNDLIDEISKNTHLSFLAIYTRLLYQNKISGGTYNLIKKNVDQFIADKKEKEEQQNLLDKQNGKIAIGIAKPINSPLLVSALHMAFSDGIISEFDVCNTLNIKTDNFNKVMQ